MSSVVSGSTRPAPWLGPPHVPCVACRLSGAVVTPLGSKLSCQQFPGSFIPLTSPRSPLVGFPKKPLLRRKLLRTSLPKSSKKHVTPNPASTLSGNGSVLCGTTPPAQFATGGGGLLESGNGANSSPHEPLCSTR